LLSNLEFYGDETINQIIIQIKLSYIMGLQFGITFSSIIALIFVIFMILLLFTSENHLHYFLFGPLAPILMIYDIFPKRRKNGITLKLEEIDD